MLRRFAVTLLVLCGVCFCLAESENKTDESDADNSTSTASMTSATSTSSAVTTTTSSTLGSSTSSSITSTWSITSTLSTTSSFSSTMSITTTSNFTTTTGATTSRTNTTVTITSTTSMTTSSTGTTSTRSSSSTTSTTSSSSSTTRVYRLYIEDAELFPAYLSVSFNHPARLADENTTWTCPELWEDETVTTFGTEPSCALSNDRMSLQVMLGKLPRVQVGDIVRMKYGVLLVDDRVVVEPTELFAVTMTRAPVVHLHGVLLAADGVQACSNVKLSLASSTGFARRTPVIEWRMSNETDEMLRTMLQPTFNEANTMMSQILEIPAQIFSDAVSAALDLEPEVSTEKQFEFEVIGDIRNWQGRGDEVRAKLTVLDVRTPLLQIAPSSVKEFSISNFEGVEMAVDLSPQVRCTNYSSADAPSELTVQWEYLLLNETICIEELPRMWMDIQLNASENSSNGSNESNESIESNESSFLNDSNDANDSNVRNISETIMIARPCTQAIWQPLENTSFRDQSRRPGSLRLPAFSFQPNSSHQFRAVSTFQGYDGHKPSVNFTVNVQDRPRPVAIITGPSEASAACPFNLSAGESYDASVSRDHPSHLQFSWSCFVGALTGLNETELLDAEECNVSIDGWRDHPNLKMEAEMLQEGHYTFMLKVRRGDPSGTNGSEPSRMDMAEGEPSLWVIRLSSQSLPLVLLHVPWPRPENEIPEVSMAGHVGPALAHVSGTSLCPVPDWTWNWVLTGAGMILALLKTTVHSMGSLIEVSTTDFRADLLLPRQSYAYALVGSRQGADWQNHQVPSMLSDLILGGAFVVESHPFLVNAPPRDGLIELVPHSGEGLVTPFSVATFGWTDEQESLLSYSFVRFPLEAAVESGLVSDVQADGGEISVQERFRWSVPKIDWSNSSSPLYFRKQGGLSLQAWDRSGTLPDLLMAVGSYFIVVRARDLQGGEGIAAVLGPVVVEPMNGTNGRTVLEASYVARDTERIMNAVDALLASPHVDWGETVSSSTDSLLTALEVAASILDPRPEALEKMAQILATVGGASPGIETGALGRAADILDNCLDLALAGPEAGVGSIVAVAMLEALSGLNERGRLTSDPNVDPGQATNYTEKMERLASKVATAAHAMLEVGESKFLSGAVDQGHLRRGVNLQLVSSSSSELTARGLDMPRLFLPQNPLPSRRLQVGSQVQTCAVSITATYWLRSNPYTWASSSKGMNQYVTTDATVGFLEFDMCGLPISFNETIPERSMRFRQITLPARRAAPRGFDWDVACARWSHVEQAWITNGVDVQRPVYWDDVEVSCVIYEADGNGTAFTAFFVPVELTTTSTTIEWTYPTYTTFAIPPLPPVYVISCNESLLPEPPFEQTWNCTKPGEGQECRAVCRGFPDQMTSVTCLKGQSSLEWFVTNICPIFTTTTLDMTIDRPADNAILGAILIFVFIIIFTCSTGIFALMVYGLYKFTVNEKSKSQIASVKISPAETEEEVEEEDSVDPAFMDWVKHWAENPTVQSAVLERKVKAKSQEALTVKASPRDPAAFAFTKTVEVEYHDYWKSELEGILLSNQIRLDAEGRLYWVVNSVREIVQVKSLQNLHQVNFPLTLRMQESPPTVEKAEGFYFWQVEWGALKGPQNTATQDDAKFDAPDEEKVDGIVPELSQRQQEHEDLMKKWREQKRSLRETADAKQVEGEARSPKTPKTQGYPSRPFFGGPKVRLADDYGGALAQAAAQASVYVPELQDQLYKEQMGQSLSEDDGWLEVQSPFGRTYYWNQFTFEEWDPPAEDLQPE